MWTEFEYALGVISIDPDSKEYKSDVEIITNCKLCEERGVYSDDEIISIENSICEGCITVCQKCDAYIDTDYSDYFRYVDNYIGGFQGMDNGKFSIYCGKCNYEIMNPEEEY
tara:strand:- start:307 stop:642 length:336 start_codon:yes stop_codon:yes gene_type:complete